MDRVLTLTVFRRVAELRSFSAAARDLQLSNAAVSKHVAALEARVKAQLLQRTTRRVSLTSAGATYLERARKVLDDLADLDDHAGDAASLRGTLRINAPLSFGMTHIVPLLPELAARWPELSIDLALTDQVVDLVAEGVDMAIRVTRKLADSSSLVAHRLVRVPYMVCAAPSYLKAHGVPKTPADLARHACIVYDSTDWVFTHEGRTARVVVGSRIRVNNSLSIRDLVVAGAGLGILPRGYVEAQLRAKQVRVVLAPYVIPPWDVHVIYPRQRHQSAKLRAVVEALREKFATVSWALKDQSS